MLFFIDNDLLEAKLDTEADYKSVVIKVGKS